VTAEYVYSFVRNYENAVHQGTNNKYNLHNEKYITNNSTVVERETQCHQLLNDRSYIYNFISPYGSTKIKKNSLSNRKMTP